MPKTALADTIDEADSLLSALEEERLAGLPELREMRDDLAFLLNAIKELAAEQQTLQARRQSVTQQLRLTRDRTQDLVIKLRSAIRARLGHRNEFLVRYRIRPIRRRSRSIDEAVGVRIFPRPDLIPAGSLESMPVPVAAAPAGDPPATDDAKPEAT